MAMDSCLKSQGLLGSLALRSPQGQVRQAAQDSRTQPPEHR